MKKEPRTSLRDRAVRLTGLARALAVLPVALAGTSCDDAGGPFAPDRAPPRVITLEPADGAVAVPLSSRVHVLFSEPVHIDSMAAPLLRVDGPVGVLAGTIAPDSAATLLTFVPADSLTPASDYRIVVRAGISDLIGNSSRDSVIARFTTALAFHDIGRIFTANQHGWDVSAIDLIDYEHVSGSPIALGEKKPVRLHCVPEDGALYVLYTSGPSGGVLVIDGRTLAILRDTGPRFPYDVADLAVSREDGILLVVSPGADTIFALDTQTLTEMRAPLRLDRDRSRPVRITVSKRFGWALVGLDGASELAAYRLPALDPVPGFPVSVVGNIHAIVVDEDRSRAWVGGSLRYAVVDLINPARTLTFQMPNLACAPRCTPRLWSMILSPAYDRVYLLNRTDAVASIGLSHLETVSELSRLLPGYQSDLVQHPRTGELVVVDGRSVGAQITLVDATTLLRVRTVPVLVGDGILDVEVMP